jgi:hypothetical protein
MELANRQSLFVLFCFSYVEILPRLSGANCIGSSEIILRGAKCLLILMGDAGIGSGSYSKVMWA